MSRVKGAALDDIFAVRGGMETPERIRLALACLFVAKDLFVPFLCRLGALIMQPWAQVGGRSLGLCNAHRQPHSKQKAVKHYLHSMCGLQLDPHSSRLGNPTWRSWTLLLQLLLTRTLAAIALCS